MRTVQRKAREVADRERQLVDLALKIIQDDGFHNLTLGRLAERAAYSKGTVYNHFTSREDLLIELSAESARRQLRYFRAVSELPWDSVWLLYGLAVAYLRHAEISPVLFECSVTARTDSVCELASEYRLTRRDQLESELAQIVNAVTDRVVADGRYDNPQLPPAVAVDAMRSLILGYALMHLLSSRFLWVGKSDVDTRLLVLVSTFHGLGWPRLELAELQRIHRTVVDLIESVERE